MLFTLVYCIVIFIAYFSIAVSLFFIFSNMAISLQLREIFPCSGNRLMASFLVIWIYFPEIQEIIPLKYVLNARFYCFG